MPEDAILSAPPGSSSKDSLLRSIGGLVVQTIRQTIDSQSPPPYIYDLINQTAILDIFLNMTNPAERKLLDPSELGTQE